MKDILTEQVFKTRQVKAALDEGAYARRNEDCGRFELGALICLHMPLTVFCGFDVIHQLLEVKLWREGFDLLLQLVNQLLTRAERKTRNVVNGFVGVKLDALTAHLRQSIHHVAADVLKP